MSESSARSSLPVPRGAAVRQLLAFGAAFVLTWLSHHGVPAPDWPSVLWLPSGLAVAVGLRRGYPSLLTIALGVLTAEIGLRDSVDHGVAFALATLAHGAVARALWRRWHRLLDAGLPLECVRDVWGLVLWGVFCGALAFAVCVAGLDPGGSFSENGSAIGRFMGVAFAGMSGAMIVAPALLVRWTVSRPLRRPRVYEGGGAFLGLLVTAGLVFLGGLVGIGAGALRPHIMLPFLLWIAVRFPLPWITAAHLLLGGFAAAGTLAIGSALAPALAAGYHPHPAQGFLLIIILTFLTLSALSAERGQVEHDLRRSESRYRDLVESVSDWIWETDGRGNFTYSNPRVRTILGCDVEQLLGKTPFDFMDPGDVERVRKILFQGADCEVERPLVDFAMRTAHGDTVHLESSCAPKRGQGGQVVGYRGVSRDVTAHRRADAALREANQRFSLLADNVRDVFWISDPRSHKLIYVSPAAEELSGRKTEEILDLANGVMDLTVAEDRPVIEAARMRSLRGEALEAEFRILRTNGVVRWVRIRGVPATAADAAQLTCGVAEDITEEKKAEERREASREALIREVHHRIKNDLQSVAGLLRLHADQTPTIREPVEAAVAKIRSIAEVHGLQSRMGHSQVVVRDLLAVIVADVAKLTGARLECRDPDAGTVGIAEKETVALSLILNELLLNAVKHRSDPGESGSVRIACEQGAMEVAISVCNAGSLPTGFDFDAGRGMRTGLELVRSLLAPAGMRLEFRSDNGSVCTMLRLTPPVIVFAQGTATTGSRAG